MQALSASQCLRFMGACRKDEVERNARMGKMVQTKVRSFAIGLCVIHVCQAGIHERSAKQSHRPGPSPRTGRADRCPEWPGGDPSVYSQGADQTIRRCRLGKGLEHSPEVTGH